jgi:hypothetical protein
MAAPSDLTSLAAVKLWGGISVSDSDAQLSALISSASRAILSSLSRPAILPTVYTDRYDSRIEQKRLMLRNWPVISVTSVQVGSDVLSAVNPLTLSPINPLVQPGFGYALEPDRWDGAPPGAPQSLDFFSWRAFAGRQGIQVVYTAGYQSTDAAVIPATPYQVTALAPYGAWASDQGVVFSATGAALTAVTGTPSTGQYSVTAGVYTFAAADAGKAVQISYGFVPFDLAQACIELVMHRFTAQSRVGVKSKSLGGQETVSYDTSGIPASVAAMVQPYAKVVPW